MKEEKIKVGMVFKYGGKLYYVVSINESRAVCVLYDFVKNKKFKTQDELKDSVINLPPNYLISISPNSVVESVNIKVK